MKKLLNLRRRTTPDDYLPPNGDEDPNAAEQANEAENARSILMDATCAPADIKYPTDLNLLNDARELTESLIDQLRKQQKNLRYCAERGIRLSGPRLGRPAKIVDPELLKLQLADNSARNAIEGKFGQCKRRLGLDRVMARRKDCSETVIAVAILAANLIRWEQETAKLLPLCFHGMFFDNRCDENTVAFCA